MSHNLSAVFLWNPHNCGLVYFRNTLIALTINSIYTLPITILNRSTLFIGTLTFPDLISSCDCIIEAYFELSPYQSFGGDVVLVAWNDDDELCCTYCVSVITCCGRCTRGWNVVWNYRENETNQNKIWKLFILIGQMPIENIPIDYYFVVILSLRKRHPEWPNVQWIRWLTEQD